ncbi:MAG: Patatin, partial [Capsulimonas sp.]|nr:Patatin [Capsulimonas sp.]
MQETTFRNSAPLHGVRVWLSGAVPAQATELQRSEMLEFVASFALAVFQAGGHLLHGSHPTFVSTLLEQAKQHRENGGRKDCLVLGVSKFWSKDTQLVPIHEWREHCMVYEIPEIRGEAARDESLKSLREWMSDRCDVLVTVGGNWWREIAGRSGVPIEVECAVKRGVPSFLLGGLGGAARDYVTDHPELIGLLKNGLDKDANLAIATEENVANLVSRVYEQLTRLSLVRGRVSNGISFRILALDGGGIRGAYTAAVLARLEEALGSSL